MNPGKRDKWPRYDRPRFVLINRERRYERPWQGYVVDIKESGRQWEALVAWVDDEADGQPMRLEWLSTSKLRFAEVDPNPPRDEMY